MRKLILYLPFVCLLPYLAGGAQAGNAPSQRPWVERHDEFSDLLRTAEIVTVEDIGMGVTAPKRAHLKKGAQELSGVFKPIKKGRHRGFWESYEAEIAAYLLDKMLGLDMVPPTVERRVEGNLGSLQLWVDDSKLYKEVEGQAPQTPQWMYQLSRMKMFDVLINNGDRNAQNFLVDPEFNVILIDHSRAFISGKKILREPDRLPNYFDRQLVTQLKALTREQLDAQFTDLLMGGQIDGILERRDGLLAHLDKLIKEHGEAGVLFN